MNPILLELTGIAHGGEAFGRHQGKLVFVPYAIPGETVEVEIVEEKARWARARLHQVVHASPDRVEPPCPYFGQGQCGGCHWQHIAYDRQVTLKAEIVADQLRRLGGVADPPVLDAIALADEDGLLAYQYRNHVQFVTDEFGHLAFVRDAQGRSGQASNEGSPSDVIAIERCLLLHPLLDEMQDALGTRVGVLEDPEEDSEQNDVEEAEPVRIRRVGLRAGINTGQRLLAFDTEGDRAPAFLIEDMPVRVVVRRRNGSVQPLVGDPWVEEIAAERVYRVSANSFFQVNSLGADALVELAAEMLALQGHETLLDGYCGVGLFALSLAKQVGQVIAIEESEAACEDFAWNAGDLDNVALFEGPVADVLAALLNRGGSAIAARIDVAIIDPPRSGAGSQVVERLRELSIPKLLYISCDPATLARDTRLLLKAGYSLQQVQPVDLFPQTYHIESLALFAL